LKTLIPDEWIEIDCHYRQHMSLKRDLFNERKNDVLMYKSMTEKGSKEVLDMLIDYLPQRFPNMFRKTKTGIDNLITGESFNLTEKLSIHPLEIGSRLVQEDLVLMQYEPIDEMYHANVC
ncbi:unnamed protein product, partial [Didymodactylos carnosus]